MSKRLLILGGSSWKSAIKKYAEEHDIVLIGAGYDANAPYYDVCQKKYLIDSTDAEAVRKVVSDERIDGIYPGGSEPVIAAAIRYIRDLGYSTYYTDRQWENLQNKSRFKELCRQCGLPVVEGTVYSEGESMSPLKRLKLPVIVKPVDGSGSKGFCVCSTEEELVSGIQTAMYNSVSKQVIIESYVKNRGMIVYYSVSNGDLVFCGSNDKYPVDYEVPGTFVNGLELWPSRKETEFRTLYEEKVKKLVKKLDMREGSFWIEVFQNDGVYWFNECGYRFDGMTAFYATYYFYGINQLGNDIHYALTGENGFLDRSDPFTKKVLRRMYYAIYPIHCRKGTIHRFCGVEELEKEDNVAVVAIAKGEKATIPDDGSFGQVAAMIHFVFDKPEDFCSMVDRIHSVLRIEDAAGNDMITRKLDKNEVIYE